MASRRGVTWILTASVLVSLTAAAHVFQDAASAGALAPASAEVETFVREALADRLVAGDIPDIHLLRRADAKRFHVRAELPGSRIRITSRALPSTPGTELALVTLADAQEAATRTGQPFRFVVVDHVNIAGTQASLWLGVGLVVPPGFVKMCCCERQAEFERREGRWLFERWGKGGRCY